jgi:hypothetical protein
VLALGAQHGAQGPGRLHPQAADQRIRAAGETAEDAVGPGVAAPGAAQLVGQLQVATQLEQGVGGVGVRAALAPLEQAQRLAGQPNTLAVIAGFSPRLGAGVQRGRAIG